MAHLRPCVSCERHVLATSSICPFCGMELAVETAAVMPMPHLGRAALVALAASVVACHDDTKSIAPTPSATASAAVSATASAAPSAAPTATASASASASAATSAVASAAPVDAGVKKDAGAKVVTTATATATWRNIAKPYGAPPPRDRRLV